MRKKWRTVKNPSGPQIVGAGRRGTADGTMGNQSWPEAGHLASEQIGGDSFRKGRKHKGWCRVNSFIQKQKSERINT